MKSKFRAAFALTGLSLVCFGSPGTASTVWNGTSQGDWFDAAEWNNGVPTANVRAEIISGRAEILQSAQAAEADSIVLGNGFQRGHLLVGNGATLRSGTIWFTGLETCTFDGATFEFTDSAMPGWSAITAGPGDQRVRIESDGLTLDTGSGLSSFFPLLTGSGRLVKTGSGILELAQRPGSSFTGTVEVREGELRSLTVADYELSGGRLEFNSSGSRQILSTLSGSQGAIEFTGGGDFQIYSDQSFSGNLEVGQNTELTIGDGTGSGALQASELLLNDGTLDFLVDDDWQVDVKGSGGTMQLDHKSRLTLALDETDAPALAVGMNGGELVLKSSSVPLDLTINGGEVSGAGTIGELAAPASGVRFSNVPAGTPAESGLRFTGTVSDNTLPWTFVFSSAAEAKPFRVSQSFAIPGESSVELQGDFPPGSYRLLQAEGSGSIQVSTGLLRLSNAPVDFFHVFYREAAGRYVDLVVMDAEYFDWHIGQSWGGANFAPDADPDGDGLSNNLERFFDRDPLDAEFSPVFSQFEFRDEEGAPVFALDYQRLAGATGVHLIASKDLQTWRWLNGYAGGGEVVLGTSGGGGGDLEPGGEPLIESVRAYATGDAADFRFFAFTDDTSIITPYLVYTPNYLALPAGTVFEIDLFDQGDGTFLRPTSPIRVMEVVSVSGGRASLDVDGSGSAASATQYAALGITEAERDEIAAQFGPGTSFFRYFAR